MCLAIRGGLLYQCVALYEYIEVSENFALFVWTLLMSLLYDITAVSELDVWTVDEPWPFLKRSAVQSGLSNLSVDVRQVMSVMSMS